MTEEQETIFDGEKQQEDTETEDEDSDGPGRYPVMTNSDDQAAWINTDKNGNTYLSVKISDGDYVNLFPQSDHLQIALNQIHEVQKQQ